MNQHERNKLKMYKAVEAICLTQQTDWEELPAFVSAFTQFTTKLQELKQAAYKQSVATAGVTANRNQLLEMTIEQAHLIGNALRALAAASNNELLAGLVDFPKSQFKRGGNELTLQYIDRVLNNVNGHLPALADYGIFQEHVDTLTALRQQLESVIGSPREAIIDRKQETQTISELIDELDILLKDHLDRLIEIVKPSHPALYKRYKSARIIVDHKGKKNDHGEDEEDDPDLGGNPGSEGTK